MGSPEAWIVLAAGVLALVLSASPGPKTASAAIHPE
jgi:hypothetical protein